MGVGDGGEWYLSYVRLYINKVTITVVKRTCGLVAKIALSASTEEKVWLNPLVEKIVGTVIESETQPIFMQFKRK